MEGGKGGKAFLVGWIENKTQDAQHRPQAVTQAAQAHKPPPGRNPPQKLQISAKPPPAQLDRAHSRIRQASRQRTKSPHRDQITTNCHTKTQPLDLHNQLRIPYPTS